jgi:hypothetical protein
MLLYKPAQDRLCEHRCWRAAASQGYLYAAHAAWHPHEDLEIRWDSRTPEEGRWFTGVTVTKQVEEEEGEKEKTVKIAFFQRRKNCLRPSLILRESLSRFTF